MDLRQRCERVGDDNLEIFEDHPVFCTVHPLFAENNKTKVRKVIILIIETTIQQGK